MKKQHSRDLENYKISGNILKQCFEYIKPKIKPDVTTEYLDNQIEKFIIDNGCIPILKNYKNYPKASCISINNQICHGIPDCTKIREGDVVKLDICLNYVKNNTNYITDSCITIPIEPITLQNKYLIEKTEQALLHAIKNIYPYDPIVKIGLLIEDYINNAGLNVYQMFTGHRISKKTLHSKPIIPHFYTEMGFIKNEILKPGWVITIEPIVTFGDTRNVILGKNNWTYYSFDNSISAQFEHSIFITENGIERLT